MIRIDNTTGGGGLSRVPEGMHANPGRTRHTDPRGYPAPPGIQPGENRELVAYVENQTDEARFIGTGENFVYSGFRLRPRLAIFESL